MLYEVIFLYDKNPHDSWSQDGRITVEVSADNPGEAIEKARAHPTNAHSIDGLNAYPYCVTELMRREVWHKTF